MKNEDTSKKKDSLKQISLVILRLEVDDSNIENYRINASNPYISDTLYFNTNSNVQEVETQVLLKDHDQALFIGKRQPRIIQIETYLFKNKATHMTDTNSSKNKLKNNEFNSQQITANPELVANAMTMQKALETAYNDWNREKVHKNELKTEVGDEQFSDELNTTLNEDNVVSDKSPCVTNNKKDEQALVSEDQKTSEIAYYFGNPTVDLVKGFIHIYKDCNLKQFDEANLLNNTAEDLEAVNLTQKRSEMICMLGIPSTVSCNELLDFIMPFNDNLQYMRILRDTIPNQYMALFKFNNQSDADLFYVHNNNKPFNSIEDYNHCHLAFIERLEIIKSSKGASKPIPGFTELPACYICLERMDESLNGVISILCNHSFHTNCLSKWGDICCPVCRYSQTPDYNHMDNVCTECGSNENLWICLICGYIGCGRYAGGHAHYHFKETQHTYSMELGSNKVWDYAADNYVHRLIQNKTDGKLVQFDEGSRQVNRDEKVDSITLERQFFEERLSKGEEKAKLRLEEVEQKWSELSDENRKLKESLQHITKDKTSLEKKYTNLTSKFNKMQLELTEEKELNKCLTMNQEIYQKKLSILDEKLKNYEKEKSREIEDLQSQLRDVMFYLDAQSKMTKEATKEEIQESSLLIQQEENPSGGAQAPKISNSVKMANRRKRK